MLAAFGPRLTGMFRCGCETVMNVSDAWPATDWAAVAQADVARALAEDVGSGDLTAALIDIGADVHVLTSTVSSVYPHRLRPPSARRTTPTTRGRRRPDRRRRGHRQHRYPRR